jgi:hypothetical protein
MNPINDYCNDEVGKILAMRKQEIESRLRALSMSQMFSFWTEVQIALVDASDEIARLKEELKNAKQS